ncbi:MAG: protein kinase, partial [Deltaproteobacteria bacterium]|nr:protein kinase [Deltaproteobacteria bacterium]
MSGTQTYPRLFGKYAIVAPLARGGMGELHLAISGEAELKKLCVIKQIIGHLSDREFVRRFLDEAKLVIKLSHQNLVPIFESGVEDGQYYLVMEYIEGKDLRAVWKTLQEQKRTCPLEVSLHIVKEICRGLSYAHTYGELELVHRDISPPNVLLSYPGEIRITDFGLALSRLKVQKTAPGILFGKLAYMSPEQARNEPIDPRTDIFAVGVIFWEFVTGQRLFPRKGTQLEQLQHTANPKIPRPSQVKKGLPAAIDLIALRALAPNREDRYPTAEALRRDIAGLLAKIAPTTDNASVAQLLRDLYGDAITTDHQDREDLLDRLTPAIRHLRDEAKAKSRHSEPRDLAGAAQEVTNEDEGEDLTDDLPGPKPTIQPGTVLGQRYRIETKLREGGMGIVYSATHTGIDKIVAVKVLHPAYSRMPDVVARFRREARAASRIGHPNIIEIFDSGETDKGAVYFVMEHLIGQDLADLLEDAGALPIDRVLGIAGQICQAV